MIPNVLYHMELTYILLAVVTLESDLNLSQLAFDAIENLKNPVLPSPEEEFCQEMVEAQPAVQPVILESKLPLTISSEPSWFVAMPSIYVVTLLIPIGILLL